MTVRARTSRSAVAVLLALLILTVIDPPVASARSAPRSARVARSGKQFTPRRTPAAPRLRKPARSGKQLTPRRTPAAPRPRKPARATERPSREQIERDLDSVGWDWRAAGVTLRIGYHPQECCHWGVYDFRDRTMWLGPSAFANDSRLRYVSRHELAHAWQWTSGHLPQIKDDMRPWGRAGMAALEAQADCVVALWGAGRGRYWNCPPPAMTLAARRLNGDWG